MTTPQPFRPHFSLAGLVWIVCGLILLAAKVGFSATPSSAYWAYLGGLMILFGLVRLFYDFIRGPRKTKPGFWSRIL